MLPVHIAVFFGQVKLAFGVYGCFEFYGLHDEFSSFQEQVKGGHGLIVPTLLPDLLRLPPICWNGLLANESCKYFDFAIFLIQRHLRQTFAFALSKAAFPKHRHT